jgi:hypothetical protein
MMMMMMMMMCGGGGGLVLFLMWPLSLIFVAYLNVVGFC